MNFDQIFNEFISVLDLHKTQLYKFQFYPEKLKEIKKSLTIHSDKISYSFSTINLVIPSSYLPSHSIPKALDSIQLILSIKDEIIIKQKNDTKIEDPLVQLNKFNLILYCPNNHYTSSWHLDRHISSESDNTSKNIHPIYHLTFGGYHMENLQKDDSDEFGKSLILRTPRIMHPPMELLLGLDFIFNQFIPKKELDLLTDSRYLRLVNELKKQLWLPYSLALAKNYCDTIDTNNSRKSFDESFVKSIIGI